MREVDQWRSCLTELVVVWDQVIAGAQDERQWRRRQQVSLWRESFARLEARQTELQLAGRWLGGRADMLGIIGYSRRETVHSAMVAWLLDPTRRHGLGIAFLERILARCFPDEAFQGLEKARTECEVARDGPRVDIVVWAPDWTIVIENKVDAAENPGQCDAYFSAFAEDPDPHFVFLSPSGKRPRTATGDAAEAYRSLSYSGVIECLTEALRETADSGVTGHAVAAQYLASLREEF